MSKLELELAEEKQKQTVLSNDANNDPGTQGDTQGNTGTKPKANK